MIIYQWLQVIIRQTAFIFFQSEGSIKLITMQFKNWLFLAYHSLCKHIKDTPYFPDSLIFSVSFYKKLQCVSQQSFLHSVTMSCFITEILFMGTEIYIYTFCVCIYLSVKQKYHFYYFKYISTSTFGIKSSFTQLPHNDRKKEYTNISAPSTRK